MSTKFKILLFIALSIMFNSCLSKQKPNDLKHVGHMIRVNENMYAAYYDDSILSGLVTVPKGEVCKFYPNGMIKSVFSGDTNKTLTDIVHFDDSGKVIEMSGFDRGEGNTSILFKDYGIIESYPHLAVIGHSNTFVTLDPDKDTIKLGETYSAKILVNFPIKDHVCDIFKAHSKGDYEEFMAQGTEATFTETPKDIGEHHYMIGVCQVKYVQHNGKKDSVFYNQVIHVVARYYVKPKESHSLKS